MSVSYTTITSKGQITLPVEARRALGLKPGQKVAVHVEGDRLVIDAPHDIAQIRFRLAGGARGRIEVSNAAAGASNLFTIRVFGETN